MIYGIGVDIVATQRLQAILQKYGDKFAQRVLSSREWSAWKQRTSQVRSLDLKASKLAKYWAAKEATSKAFGTGFSCGISWRDIELEYNDNGKPSLHFQAAAKKWAKENNITASHISFSDEHRGSQKIVIAMVVLEN